MALKEYKLTCQVSFGEGKWYPNTDTIMANSRDQALLIAGERLAKYHNLMREVRSVKMECMG